VLIAVGSSGGEGGGKGAIGAGAGEERLKKDEERKEVNAFVGLLYDAVGAGSGGDAKPVATPAQYVPTTLTSLRTRKPFHDLRGDRHPRRIHAHHSHHSS